MRDQLSKNSNSMQNAPLPELTNVILPKINDEKKFDPIEESINEFMNANED